MTLGNFTAFNSYLALLIFPILVIGFMSNVIAQAQASYGRVEEVLELGRAESGGDYQRAVAGRHRGEVASPSRTARSRR